MKFRRLIAKILIPVFIIPFASCEPAKKQNDNDAFANKAEGTSIMKYKDLDMVVNFGHWSIADDTIKAISTAKGGEHQRGLNEMGAIVSFYKPGEKLQDYTVSATKNTSASDVFSIIFRAKSPQDCLQFTRYGREASLYIIKDGVANRIYNAAIGECKARETIKVEVSGNNVKGYVENQLVVDQTFGSGDIYPDGIVGLQTNHNNAFFEDFSLAVQKSQKAGKDVKDIEITNFKLSNNNVGRQTIYVDAKSDDKKNSVLNVSCYASAIIADTGYGGFALSENQNLSDVEMSADISSDTLTAGLVLRAAKGEKGDSYIIYGRYCDLMSLYHVKDGETKLLEYYAVEEDTEVKNIKAKIRGNKFTGYLNGEKVIEYRFKSGDINNKGEVGLITDIQNTKIDNVTVNNSSIDLKSYIGTWKQDGNTYEMTGIAPNAGFKRYLKFEEEIPVEPFVLSGEGNGTFSYTAPFFALYEGPVKLVVSVWDSYGRHVDKTLNVNLSAPEGTYDLVDGTKFFDNIEPHALWRAKTLADNPTSFSVGFPNYVWRIYWNKSNIMLVPRTISHERDEIGRKMIDGAPITITPVIKDENGNNIDCKITRFFEGNTSVYGVQPSFEFESAYGKAVFNVLIFNGDPIIRITGKFIPSKDCKVNLSYYLSGETETATIISPANKFSTSNFYHMFYSGQTKGPLFAVSYNKKPLDGSDLTSLNYHIDLTGGKDTSLPMVAVSLVDADAVFDRASSSKYTSLGKLMAETSLAVPTVNASMKDRGLSEDKTKFILEYVRDYKFIENDYGIADKGQFFAIPWCAQDTLDKDMMSGYGYFHSAFGNRPYVVTKKSAIKMNMPMPDLSPDALAPDYTGLNGVWAEKAKKDLEFFLSLQLPDGTYDRYSRMDQYSLGRVTLGLMMAYPGLKFDNELQKEIAAQVKLSLTRMLGLQNFKILSTQEIQKYYGTLYQYQTFEKGSLYQPFTYHPQWDFHTENYGFVDQNLGQVHVFYSLYLYGKYIDPSFLKRVDVQERIKQMIKFQWMNQELNGDIYRVVIGGQNAAGSGDGYEEDLVLMLPELAKMADLNIDWYNRACRIAAMKFGALKHFDYIPVENEYEMEFCTPIHVMDHWTPEAGWNNDSFGDVWFMGPCTAGSVYGKWYYNSVLKGRNDIINFMLYDKYEEYKDIWGTDMRFWLSTNGQVTEAYMTDPFLGAVKLMMAYSRARKRTGCLDSSIEGEHIWNLIFFSSEMVLINDEQRKAYSFMEDSIPVDKGVDVTDFNYGLYYYTYCWKLADGSAVISSASYNTKDSSSIVVTPDADKLGLSKTGKWTVTQLGTAKTFSIDAGSSFKVDITPRRATTFIIRDSK